MRRRRAPNRGIDLNTFAGQRFKVGDVEYVGRRLCEPCAHLERLTHKGVLRKPTHRGGIRADIRAEPARRLRNCFTRNR